MPLIESLLPLVKRPIFPWFLAESQVESHGDARSGLGEIASLSSSGSSKKYETFFPLLFRAP